MGYLSIHLGETGTEEPGGDPYSKRKDNPFYRLPFWGEKETVDFRGKE